VKIMPRPPRLPRAATRLAVAVAFVATLAAMPAASPSGSMGPSTVRAAAACTGWTSETLPPTTIRVLRTEGDAAGSVQVVPFRDYVNVVMAAEWGPSNPTEALKAGAVAVKEYAWYRAMVWRGKSADDGSCYDVADSTLDQVYAPERRTPSPALAAAVDSTWETSVRKAGHLFATHYQGGADVACAADADGRWLFQTSAMRCARDGMTAEAILGAYYWPDVEIVGAGPVVPSPSPVTPQAPSLTLMAGDSIITWGQDVRLTAGLTPPGTVGAGGRTVHLQRSLDRVAWDTAADLTTDASGAAIRVERPATNAYYRLVFEAATDLTEATSPVVRVLVRRLAHLQPGAAPTTRRVAPGTTVTFTTVARPARTADESGPVGYRLLRLVGRAWVVSRSWTVMPNAAGVARLRVTLPSAGTWTVRAVALRTATNAIGTWSMGPRYDVR
jgi:hypothetical protein